MSRQNVTGDATERTVRTRLLAMGLKAEKPKRDVGVDLEVWRPTKPNRILKVQIKGRGAQQKNGRHRWFQVRTTPWQRKDAVQTGLPISDAWRKKVGLCDYFVLVSEKHGECWVFPTPIVGEVIAVNRALKHGKRADNRSGEHAEMDLDLVECDGRPLTEVYATYKDNFGMIGDALKP